MYVRKTHASELMIKEFFRSRITIIKRIGMMLENFRVAGFGQHAVNPRLRSQDFTPMERTKATTPVSIPQP